MAIKCLKTHYIVNLSNKIYLIILLNSFLFLCFTLFYSGVFYEFYNFMLIRNNLLSLFLIKTLKFLMLLVEIIIIYIVCLNQEHYQKLNVIKFSRNINFITKKFYEISIIVLLFNILYLLLEYILYFHLPIFHSKGFLQSYIYIFLKELLILEIISLLNIVFNKNVSIILAFFLIIFDYLLMNTSFINNLLIYYKESYFKYNNILIIIILIVILFLLENLINLLKEY